MMFSLKKASGALLLKKASGALLLCLLMSSNSYINAFCGTTCEPKGNRGQGRYTYNGPEIISSMTAQEAYSAGEDVVKFVVKYCVSLGQGNFFQDLKMMLKQGCELKNKTQKIRSFGPLSPLSIAFVKGIGSQLEAEDVNDFMAKARFTEGQKKIVCDVWNFSLNEIRALKNMEPEKWVAYSKDRMMDHSLFFANILAEITRELELGNLRCF